MEQHTITIQTYRFVFSNEFSEQLSIFAKVHQYDHRKDFKEAWLKWSTNEEINPLINDEVKRIRNLGFEGDALDKMFKSARYYYRNKKNNENKEDKERKQYETISKSIQENMDQHIYHQINKSTNNGISKISPAESFDDYLKQYKHDFINELKGNNTTIAKQDCEHIIKKYKKSYKNRFYNIRVQLIDIEKNK
jgi:predicted DNA-binding ArsR family transcriptional regulator